MRVKCIAAGLMALACVCVPSAEASRWTKKKGRQEEDKQADKMDDPLGLTRKQQQQRPTASSRSMEGLNNQLEALTSGDGEFDMTAMIKATIDVTVEQLEGYKQQSDSFTKEDLITMLKQLPDGGSGLPGLEDGVSAAIDRLDQADGKQLRAEMDKLIDALLERIKHVQKKLDQPGGLQAVLAENLQAAGASEEDIAQMQKLLSDPQALMDAAQQMASGLEELADLNLSEEQLEQLQAVMSDPNALTDLLEGSLNDEDFKNAFENADLEQMLANLKNDPEVQAAIEEDKVGASKKRGTKRGFEDVPKGARPGRRQRA